MTRDIVYFIVRYIRINFEFKTELSKLRCGNGRVDAKWLMCMP